MEANAKKVGIKRFPLTAWWNGWTDATCIWDACLKDDPYPLRCGFSWTGNFMNQANASMGWEALQSLDFMVMIDLWHVPQAGLADILMPTGTWLETPWPRLSQGPSGGQGATIQCILPPGEASTDPEILVKISESVGYTWNLADPANNPFPDLDFMLDDSVSGAGYATWKEYNDDFQKNGWWVVKQIVPERWGTYHRDELGQMQTPGSFGIKPLSNRLPGMQTVTKKVEVWSTIVETYIPDWENFVLPKYTEPPRSPINHPEAYKDYPFILTTGSRNPTFFHSEHRQLPWCREMWPTPRVEINPADAAKLGIEQGDWVWLETEFGKIRETADIYHGINEGVVNANHTWWYPECSEPKHGWDLGAVNQLVFPYDQDPIMGAATLRAYPVKVYKATPENCPGGKVIPTDENGIEIIWRCDDPRLKEWMPVYEGREA
ncbi:MAG: hypothetical protein IJJ14_07355 [Coriobacteriales bacterium]|nr:hypothetical protein [Coriobacteriales bacterium]